MFLNDELVPEPTRETANWKRFRELEVGHLVRRGLNAIRVEVANRHVHRFRSDMRKFFARRNSTEVALRVEADFLRDRLHFTGVALAFGPRAKDGSALRLQADYDLRDALVLTGGILLFREGDLPPFDSISKNDRLFLQVKYSF